MKCFKLFLIEIKAIVLFAIIGSFGCSHAELSNKEMQINLKDKTDMLCGVFNEDITNFFNNGTFINRFGEREIVGSEYSIKEKEFIRYEARTSGDKTLLMCAAEAGNYEAVRFFFDVTSNPYLKNKFGKSAYDYAAEKSNVVILRFFEKNAVRRPTNINIFSKYCTNGRQIKKLGETITVKLISPAKDGPLDEYQEKLNKIKHDARELVKNLFLYEAEDDLQEVESSKSYHSLEYLKFFVRNKQVEPSTSGINTLKDYSEIRFQYTFNIPLAVQEKIFKAKALGDIVPDPDCSDNGYVGLNNECRFSPSKALVDKSRAWKYYSYKFTRLQEAPGSTDTIIFNLDLDLNAFCEYGTSTRDLMAK